MLSAEIRELQPGAGPSDWTGDLSPIGARDWTYERAGHLLERAGFGGTPEEIERMATSSEFGRRVAENASQGTDHGVAAPMFIAGAKAKGGLYGQYPSLTDQDEGDLKMTTDFRSVYATMMREWMGFDDTKSILKGNYPTLGVFA